MRRVGIISIHLGCGSATPVDKTRSEFFLETAKAVLSEETEIVQDIPIPALPIDSETCNGKTGMIFQYIHSYETLAHDADVIVVSLEVSKGVIKGSAFSVVSYAIQSLVQAVIETHTDGVVIVLQHSFPDEKDAYLKRLKSHIDAGNLVLVSDDGSVMSANALRDFDARDYMLRLSTIQRQPIDLLRRKLIRQRGHFKRMRDQQHTHCVEFYFDGKLCESEIMLLLKEYIEKKYRRVEQPCIIYNTTMSDWLAGPIVTLCSKQEYESYPFEDIQNPAGAEVSLESSPILFITPLIDSGETLSREICELEKKKPSQIDAVAILAVHHSKDHHGEVTIPGNRKVDFFLGVQQQTYLKKDNTCPMCQLKIPFSTEGQEKYTMLTSYDFWKMVQGQDVGLKDEDNVPMKWRESLGKVPDFPAMLDSDGAWLVEKVARSLRKASGKPTNDLAIICPKQPGSKALTEYLHIVFDVDVIRIEEDAIKQTQTTSDINKLRVEWEQKQDIWYVQMKSTTTREFIVMDEFTASGKTRKGLVRILDILKKVPLCHFSIMDFCPDQASSFTVPYLSLYDWKSHNISHDAKRAVS